MRAVIAPMVADRSFYEAIPGLADALPAAAARAGRGAAAGARRGDPGGDPRRAATTGRFDRDRVRPAVAPTIPHHCSDEFILGCAALARDFDVGLHSHVAESKVQAVAGIRRLRPDADRASRRARRARAAFHRGARRLARRRRHGPARRPRRLGRAQPGQQHAARLAGSPTRAAMLERRVNLGIGTDGASCADNQNMYEAMRLASFVSKVQGPEWRRWLTTREAALAATEGSARVLGFGDRIGRIAPGYKADLVHARPRPPELAAAQRPGQPAGPYRGRHRGRQRHDRRPHGGREPPRADRRSRHGCATAPRRRASGSPPPMPTTAASTRRWSRSSAAIARASRARPTTSTATARGRNSAVRRLGHQFQGRSRVRPDRRRGRSG